jgi:5-methyltetrahydrofolate--homocysteine methyltransferase
MDEKMQAIFQSIVEGDNTGVQANVKAALAAGTPAGAILNEGLIAGMAEVGRLFEEGEYFVPEMLIAARAMKSAMTILKPLLTAGEVGGAGKVIIGTVKGDLHDIGKNLVGLMLEGAGFQVVDLGSDVSAEKYVAATKEHSPDIVAMSALLTTTMVNMRGIITALDEAGLRGKVKVMIGGAPVTDSFAQQIGADGYAADASRAVATAKALLN